MRRRVAAALLAACAALPELARAQAPGVIREIAFAGNDTTQPKTMLREVSIHEGDAADPAAIEKSRQAIQDLGLFRSVEAQTEDISGGVRVTFKVREKYYLIPSPRADTNSDGQYAYGAQVRWYNVMGLNHTSKIVVKKSNRQEQGRGEALQFDGSYYAPFIFDTPYGVDLSVGYNKEPVDGPPPYDDLYRNVRFVITRALPHDPPSQGWRVGAGLSWGDQDNIGVGAPPENDALSLVLNANYVDRHFNVYSEEGVSYGAEWAGSSHALLSDNDASSVSAHYDRSWYFGSAEHQTLGVFAEAGFASGGAGTGDAYLLGGAGDLRGYPLGYLRGQSYYYAGVEALRPVYWRWLRGIVFVESGRADPQGEFYDFQKSYADVGLGFRMRLTWFVRLELNVGYAWALRDSGDGAAGRFFATGRR